MDVQMPLLNGIEATRLIKKQWPAIKVVILTMNVAYKDDALAAGADMFLLKYCPPEEVVQAVFL